MTMSEIENLRAINAKMAEALKNIQDGYGYFTFVKKENIPAILRERREGQHQPLLYDSTETDQAYHE